MTPQEQAAAIQYRDHRGGFDESMCTARKVTRNMLAAHLYATYGPLESVEFVPRGVDTRCGWDTYAVVLNGNAVGFSDGNFGAATLFHPAPEGIEGNREGVAVVKCEPNDKPAERTPLLSDEDCNAMEEDLSASAAAFRVRAFYEAKITSGELRVMRAVRFDVVDRLENGQPVFMHDGCSEEIVGAHDAERTALGLNADFFGDKFCPGCGDWIVKESRMSNRSE